MTRSQIKGHFLFYFLLNGPFHFLPPHFKICVIFLPCFEVRSWYMKTLKMTCEKRETRGSWWSVLRIFLEHQASWAEKATTHHHLLLFHSWGPFASSQKKHGCKQHVIFTAFSLRSLSLDFVNNDSHKEMSRESSIDSEKRLIKKSVLGEKINKHKIKVFTTAGMSNWQGTLWVSQSYIANGV